MFHYLPIKLYDKNVKKYNTQTQYNNYAVEGQLSLDLAGSLKLTS